jgi:hypothetical protein
MLNGRITLGLIIVAFGFGLPGIVAAQPLPMECPQIVAELKMRPPAYGDAGRAEVVWERFLSHCEAKMGGPGAVISAEDVDALSKLLNPGTGR